MMDLSRRSVNSGFGGFPVQRHLDHRLPEAQFREQALCGIVARFAPEHNLCPSPRMNPLDCRAQETLSRPLAARMLENINVVDESTRASQISPARGLEAGEDVADDLIRALGDQHQAVRIRES